jgi:hypothetical protein
MPLINWHPDRVTGRLHPQFYLFPVVTIAFSILLFLIFGSVVWVTNKISDINIERQKKDSEAKRQSKSDQKKKDSEAQNSESNDGRGLHNSNRPTSLV